MQWLTISLGYFISALFCGAIAIFGDVYTMLYAIGLAIAFHFGRWCQSKWPEAFD